MQHKPKIAFITGITGQDGAYLAEFLLDKGYVVHGLRRRTSLFNTDRIEHLYHDRHEKNVNFFLHYGDMTDATNLIRLLKETNPDEIYNLAAQSHVHISFDSPEYTANADGIGTLRLLEAIRLLGFADTARFYQASTSELFGRSPAPQNEETPFRPCSPYATAKLYAYWSVINYREAYDMHASNGILFNHESPIRGETFVTRKITRAVAAIKQNRQTQLFMGNLNARRDWGHAKDFVRGMWMMVQQDQPGDYVLATGHTTTVRDFIHRAFACADITIQFEGSDTEEIGRDQKTGEILVRVDPTYYRPNEVDDLCGDARKAQRVLGWEPKIDLDTMIAEMVAADLQERRVR